MLKPTCSLCSRMNRTQIISKKCEPEGFYTKYTSCNFTHTSISNTGMFLDFKLSTMKIHTLTLPLIVFHLSDSWSRGPGAYPSCRRARGGATQRARQPPNLETPCTFLDCARKPGYLERARTENMQTPRYGSRRTQDVLTTAPLRCPVNMTRVKYKRLQRSTQKTVSKRKRNLGVIITPGGFSLCRVPRVRFRQV